MGNKSGHGESQSKWEVRSASVEAVNTRYNKSKEKISVPRKSSSLSKSNLARVKTQDKVSSSSVNGEPPAEADGTTGQTSSDQVARRIGKYKITSMCIGTGAFSQVRLGIDTSSGKQVAVKIIPKKNQHERQRFLREKEFLGGLHHKNVIQLLDSMEDEKYMYMVLEYIDGGDLVDNLEHHGRMSERKAQKVFRQLLDAVEYCHAHSVAHRDIKLENVLLCKKSKLVKLIDFGLAARMDETRMFTEYCGSPVYCSPEVVTNQPYDGTENDVWSLGIVLYTILTSEFPYWDESQGGLFHKIRFAEVVFPAKRKLSESVKDLITSMLRKEGAYRPTIADLKSHPWIAKRSGSSVLNIGGHHKRKHAAAHALQAVAEASSAAPSPSLSPTGPSVEGGSDSSTVRRRYEAAAAAVVEEEGDSETPKVPRRVRTSPTIH